MADLNELMRIAEEKAALKAAKSSQKTPEAPKKKVVKGIRPYMSEKEIAQLSGVSEEDRKFLEDIKPTPVAPQSPVITIQQPAIVETRPIEIFKPEPVELLKEIRQEVKPQRFDKVNTSSNKVEIHQEAKSFEYLEKGYTKFPNEVLQRMIEGEFSKREMQVILLLARMSAGFGGRQWTKISNGRISEITGIATNHISVDMKSLVEVGIIQKSVSENRSDANSYRVVYDHKNAYLEANYDENTLPHDLKVYLDGLVRAQKDGEKKAIFELLEQKIEPEVLFAAIKKLKKEGLGGQPVSNPAAYLKKSGSDVLHAVRRKIQESQSYSNEQRLSVQDQQDEIKVQEIRIKFESTFGAEQRDTKINELINKYNLQTSPIKGTQVPYFIAEKLAVQKWAEEQGII